MDKNSLDEAFKVCSEAIYNSNINVVDKLELIINLYHFLNVDEYEETIKQKALVRSDRNEIKNR